MTFTVRDAENGRPVAGADITIAPANGSSPLTGRTDPRGEATFTGAPVGLATITIAAPGYRSVTETIGMPSSSSSDLPRFEVLLELSF